MIPPPAIDRFKRAQKQLLRDTYDMAWRHGVKNYLPDPNPQGVHVREVSTLALALGGTAALLLARRARAYLAPSEPDPGMRAAALSGALNGIDSMAVQLAQLQIGPESRAAADAAVIAGDIGAGEANAYALADALGVWADQNEWRLNNGDSVAWAGEQDGYAQAADADGMLLEWVAEDDDSVCDDCLDLSGLPPMPRADFPTTPGAGDTDCNVGCRCSMEATDELAPGDELWPLSETDQSTLDRIAQQAGPQLAAVG